MHIVYYNYYNNKCARNSKTTRFRVILYTIYKHGSYNKIEYNLTNKYAYNWITLKLLNNNNCYVSKFLHVFIILSFFGLYYLNYFVLY